MSEIDITPGFTFSDNTPVTPANLNALGNPTAAVSSGTVTATDVLNYFREPDFDKYAFNSRASSGQLTFSDSSVGFHRQGLTRHWFAAVTGSAAVTAESQDVGDETEVNGQGASAIKFVGGATATSVELGQFVPQSVAQTLILGNFTVGFYCYNNTGAAVTPVLRVYTTPNPNENYENRVLDQSANMTSCPDGAWQLTTATIDGTTIGATGLNGLEIVVDLPNTLQSGSEEWWFLKPQLITGSTANTNTPRRVPEKGIPAIVFSETQTSGTDAGASSTGSFANQRSINTVESASTVAGDWAGMYGRINGTSDGVILSPGVYWMKAEAPFIAGSACHSKLNINAQQTGALTIDIYGPNAYAVANQQGVATCEGLIKIDHFDQEVLVKQEVSVARAADGLGQAASIGTERYAMLYVWRLSEA